MDLISVIVPVYNVESYVEECIQSVLNQSYQNLEIILVDDGSTDKSGEICEKFTYDKRVTVLHKENGGLSSARNFALEIVKGEYLSFIDSDDYIDKYFIEKLYNALKIQKDNCKISMCRFTREENSFMISEKKIKLVSSEETLKNILYQKDDSLYSVAACNKLYHRSVFEKIDFPESFINEDMFVICEVLSETKYVAVIDYNGYYYRINNNSITQKRFSPKNLDVVKACDHIMNYVEKHFNSADLKKAAVNLKFRRCYQMLYKLWMSNEKYEDYENILFSFIKANKTIVLKDKNSKFSSKLTALMALTGKFPFKIFTKIVYGLKKEK